MIIINNKYETYREKIYKLYETCNILIDKNIHILSSLDNIF